MGRHHTNPPQPRHPPPKRSQHRHKEEGQGPPAPHTEQGPTTGGDGQPDTPHPRRAHEHGPRHGNKERGGTEEPQPLYEPRPTHPPPNPPHGGPGHPATRRANKKGGDGRHRLVVVTAPGKRPATFRTWKLSPAAPMVLHPRGCGRVGNRHNTPPGGPRTCVRGPPTHTRERDHARNNAHAPPRATTRTHASAHKRHPAGDNTRTPQTSTHTRPQRHGRDRAPGRPIAHAFLPT